MVKKLSAFLLIAACCCFSMGETATVRTIFKDGRKISKSVKLEDVSESVKRLTVPKSELSGDVRFIDVVADFAPAKKGDDGYWIHARGTYGKFDKDSGSYGMSRQVIPVWGMKTPSAAFWANVRTYRFDYQFRVEVKNGNYEVFARFDIENVRKWFEPYNDIVVDFNLLSGEDANYSGMGRGYRKFQLERGAVRTIKDRIKDFPELDYLCDAIVVRIQTHAAKPIPEKSIDFTKETELPVVVHMPFGVAEEFVKALKDAGIDKLSICSAGWNFGGYDGRTPQHLPVCAEAGGEDALRRFIETTQKLGFQISAHATLTDCYTVSPMWSPDYVGKYPDGSLDSNGLWSGGKCYRVCQKASYNGWVLKELEDIRSLGFKGPHYIDVYSATYPNRCSDKNHSATPEEMAEYQNRILARAKKVFGGAASEAGFDHVAGNIDYINYVDRVMKQYEDHPEKYPLVSGVYPLWEIVYHGIILYNPDRLTQNHTRGRCLYKLEKSGDPRWMEGDGITDPKISLKIVEFGGRPIFYTYKFADVERIKKAYDEFLPVRRLQRELMESHEEISEGVFLVKYGDGSEIVCNYSKMPFKYRNENVESLSYKLYDGKK